MDDNKLCELDAQIINQMHADAFPLYTRNARVEYASCLLAAVADAEPVAWLPNSPNGEPVRDRTRCAFEGGEFLWPIPLYARPQPSDVAPLVEALEKIASCEVIIDAQSEAAEALAAWKAKQ